MGRPEDCDEEAVEHGVVETVLGEYLRRAEGRGRFGDEEFQQFPDDAEGDDEEEQIDEGSC